MCDFVRYLRGGILLIPQTPILNPLSYSAPSTSLRCSRNVQYRYFLNAILCCYLYMYISHCHVMNQEDQLSTVTAQNLALKRENESLHVRRPRYSLPPSPT